MKRDNTGRWGGWKRAQHLFAANECERCGADEGLVRHHVDRDPHNNVIENVVILCRACHARIHAAEDRAQRGARNSQAKLDESSVRLIRTSTATNLALSVDLGVDPSLISKVRSRKVWDHVA